MIVVLASSRDPQARRFAESFDDDVRLLTPADLSLPGWRVDGHPVNGSRIVVDGEVVESGAVDGVVSRLALVPVEELTSLHEEDRPYAAQEMAAFLAHWLSTLACRVLNPPRGVSLCGPSWRTEQWLLAASRLGIPVVPRVRRSPVPPEEPLDDRPPAQPTVAITVVGDQWFPTGEGPEGDDADAADVQRAAADALRLAAAADVPMMIFGFRRSDRGLSLTGASPWADVGHPGIARAVLGLLQGEAVA